MVLVLAVHLVNFLGWVGQWDHSKTFLPLELFCLSTPSWLKVGGGVVGGGPCDYCVSPIPNNWILGIFDRGLGTWTPARQYYD